MERVGGGKAAPRLPIPPAPRCQRASKPPSPAALRPFRPPPHLRLGFMNVLPVLGTSVSRAGSPFGPRPHGQLPAWRPASTGHTSNSGRTGIHEVGCKKQTPSLVLSDASATRRCGLCPCSHVTHGQRGDAAASLGRVYPAKLLGSGFQLCPLPRVQLGGVCLPLSLPLPFSPVLSLSLCLLRMRVGHTLRLFSHRKGPVSISNDPPCFWADLSATLCTHHIKFYVVSHRLCSYRLSKFFEEA